jgi:hypothetical protein
MNDRILYGWEDPPNIRYKYEYRSAIDAPEDEIFVSKNQFNNRFKNAHEMFKMFIEDDEIDMLQIVVGPDSYKLSRITHNEV